MPLKNIVADSLGVLTICLVGLLVLLGLFCIIYSFYFHRQIHNQGYIELGYFSGPWIVRITFILFVIWWGFGEIVRLNFLRGEGRILNSVDIKWQEDVCKGYIISNLGLAEPCLFLTLAFLLRASLQKRSADLGSLSRKWNGKTAGLVVLYCFPLFVLQLTVVLIGMKKLKDRVILPPQYTLANINRRGNNDTIVALCTYPLLSIVLMGVFGVILTAYFVWTGRRIVKRVINKGLRKRVYTLIVSISSLFPLRILFLGLSVAVSKPEEPLFEALSFLGFLSLVVCAVVNMLLLVYYPIADSLALRKRSGGGMQEEDIESLIANQRTRPEDGELGRRICNSKNSYSNSSSSSSAVYVKELEEDESISFCAREEEGEEEVGCAFVELSLFCPSGHASPLGSPQLIGWPILPSTAITPIHGS
ncbi:uncharacterized protein LOC124926617 [Impatiens glandulifera]|uniref:uncharacterized protein LOC124926617 n=1 Tax=Impatiens glandulifera TaxID=253017 RepID=UPI001FB19E18|nr:uncharacterized protein LOC124926617 [Impatiens glandulifera]XP_047322832.1 uncharacterized protein LOC124926617 [Impatiens glandulifera]